jgi:Lrp/AsnC family leucine-responsive transcriptional regulator
MKFAGSVPEFDAIDRAILERLQENCKQSLAAIGEKVGLSAPAVVERIHKLEEAGVIIGYTAVLDARALGLDITAFIGLSCDRPRSIATLEAQVAAIDDVLECHHVTGVHSLMLKVKTRDTQSLELLIDRIRALDGVTRTETMVVLSTQAERSRLVLVGEDEEESPRPVRRAGGRSRKAVS